MDNQKQSIRDKFIPGVVIGGMEIIEKIPNKIRYKIKCLKCGEIKEVHEDTLRRRLQHPDEYGCTKCTKNKQYRDQCKYYPGYRIGDYELVKIFERRQSGRWYAKCLKCGTIQVISVANAQKRSRPGCYNCNPGKGQRVPQKDNLIFSSIKPTLYSRDERYFVDYKRKIENLNKRSATTGRKYKEWKLTLPQFSNLIHQKCYYCGAEPEYKDYYTTRSFPDQKLFANGIDRIDSDLGYTVENCVPCCTICNHMKLDLTQEQFYSHINKILNYSNKCSTTIENTEKSGSE